MFMLFTLSVQLKCKFNKSKKKKILRFTTEFKLSSTMVSKMWPLEVAILVSNRELIKNIHY